MTLCDDDGKLRHTINPNGLSQAEPATSVLTSVMPATRAEYGRECRQPFGPAAGYTLVGADLKSLELRCLAHFLAPLDKGAYAKEVVEGDTRSQPTGLDHQGSGEDPDLRTLLGGGDTRLGQILGKGPQAGRDLRQRFYKANPAFEQLVRKVKNTARNRGYLIGLDGRHLPVRSEHGALNVLLQSAGALLSKKWIELVDAELTNQKIAHGSSHGSMTNFRAKRRETQIMSVESLEEMAQEAGRAFGFRVAIDADQRRTKLGRHPLARRSTPRCSTRPPRVTSPAVHHQK